MTPAQWNEYERQARVIERNQKWKEQQKQAEISDEDIKRGIKREYLFSNSEEKRLMIEGAMWYKEQLKKIESVTNCNQLTTK
jgi:hypothetical protein